MNSLHFALCRLEADSHAQLMWVRIGDFILEKGLQSKKSEQNGAIKGISWGSYRKNYALDPFFSWPPRSLI